MNFNGAVDECLQEKVTSFGGSDASIKGTFY